MKQRLINAAAVAMAMVCGCSFMMMCALARTHPVAFLHALCLTIVTGVIVALLLPFVVE